MHPDATPSCLLIVDVQRGFINDATQHIPARVEALQQKFAQVIVTRFFNPDGSPYRRLIGWSRFAPRSDDMDLAFSPSADARVIDKATYSCIDAAFLSVLKKDKIETIDICGIATDNCVLACALGLFENGFRPRVLADACASHGGPEYHEAGLMVLKRLIGVKQIVSISE